MACGKIVEAIVPVPNGENILVDQPLVVKTLYKAEEAFCPSEVPVYCREPSSFSIQVTGEN